MDVRAGLDGTVEITLPTVENLQQTVTVTAPALRARGGENGLSGAASEILKSAAALQDVSRYVQGLPGVVIGTDDFRNDIIVRGGSPLENLFVVDNVEIPNINAFAKFASAGGTVSLIDAELLQDVTFLTGGYPAPYINRTSSVLQVTQREGSREQFGGWATLGFAGAGAIVEGPINGGKGSWMVSARRSFLDLFTAGRRASAACRCCIRSTARPSTTSRRGIASGWSASRASTRFGWASQSPPTSKTRLPTSTSATTAGARHRLQLAAPSVAGRRPVRRHPLRSQSRPAGEGSGVAGRAAAGVPPEVVIARSPVVFFENSREGETTLKYDLTVHAAAVRQGAGRRQLKMFRVDYTWDRRTATTLRTRRWPASTRSSSTRGSGRIRPAPTSGLQAVTSRVNVTLGGRFDHYAILSQARLSPRAGVTVRLADTLSWNSSAGSYYQQPAFLFLSVFPQNASLVPWRADHFVAASPGRPSLLRVTAEAYRKKYSDYPVASDSHRVAGQHRRHLQHPRNPVSADQRRRGYSEGVEFFVEKRLTSKLYGQGNLSFSRTRHAGLDGVLRPGSFDYPFVFNLVGGYRLSPAWELSARLSFLSGRPYTPYDQAVSTAQRRGVYDLARVNAARRLTTAASTSAWIAHSPWAGSR